MEKETYNFPFCDALKNNANKFVSIVLKGIWDHAAMDVSSYIQLM